MAKVTLYVPDELAAEAKDADLPQSAVYQDALRAELDRRKAQQQDASEIDRAVARLRGTRDEEAQRRSQSGREDGATWAREVATLSELKALVDADTYGAPTEAAADYVRMFDGEYLDDLGLFGDIHDDDDQPYWEGFQTGATEVFDVVRGRLA
jgi:post-segregation antitoxin (ccd killing protein)